MPFAAKQTLPRDQLLELIHFATLAPSGHNTQPWKFGIRGNEIRIFPDFARRLPVVDPDDHALYISLGCALENLLVAAAHKGFRAEVETFPSHEPQECLVVYLSPGGSPGETELFNAIPRRQSTRSSFTEHGIPAADLRKLEVASRREGVLFRIFTEPREILKLLEFVKEAGRRQFSDPAFVEELLAWIRFSKREVKARGDGLAARAMGFPALPRWLGKRLFKLLATPESEARRVEKLIRSSSELMLFSAARNDRHHWVDLGRSFERVALTATSLNIKQAHMNMPCEVLDVRRKLQEYLRMEEAQPLLLLRIGYGSDMPRSPRRPLQSVLI